MLFDSTDTINENRLITKNTINEDTVFFPEIINTSLENMSESFFNESNNFLYKEGFAKTRNNLLYLNESVEDFIISFKSIMDDVIKDFDNTFDKFAKSVAKKFMKDKKFIDTYSDEFMACNLPIKVKMYKYSITNDVPNYKFLNTRLSDSSFSVDINKIDPSKLKKFKKDDKEYDRIRAEILGYKNKKIKADDFKDECWAVYRSGSDKQVEIELTPDFKHEILTTILSCEAELHMLDADKNLIVDFISYNINQVVNDFNFVSKHSDNLSKYEYDAYTTFIYNKINEMRMLIKYYETAYAYKMDAIKERRKDYISIFKEVVTMTEKSEETILISEDKLDQYLIREDSDDIFYNIQLNETSELLMQYLYDEDMNLINEDVFDTLSKVVDKLQEMLKKTTNLFVNKTYNSFNKAFPSEENFAKLDLGQFKRDINYYNDNVMKSTMNTVRELADKGKNDENTINEFAKDPQDWLTKNFQSALGRAFDGKSEWSEFVKSQLRGQIISNPKQAITRAFDYCEDSKFNSLKENVGKVGGLENLLKSIDQDIVKARNEARASGSVQNNSADLLMTEDEKPDNSQNEATTEQRAQTAGPDDNNNLTAGATGKTSFLQNKKKYFLELQHIQGWVWGILEEGRSEFIKYLRKINEFERIRNGKSKVANAVNKTTTKIKQTVKRNENADLFDAILDIDYLKAKILSECNLTDDTLDENLFYDTLDHATEGTELIDKMKRDLDTYSENSDELLRVTNGYTNLFSKKLNKYIKNGTFLNE